MDYRRNVTQDFPSNTASTALDIYALQFGPTLYDVADQTQFVNDNFKLAREEERREQLNLASASAAPPIHPSEKCQNVMIRGELRSEQVCETAGERGRKK